MSTECAARHVRVHRNGASGLWPCIQGSAWTANRGHAGAETVGATCLRDCDPDAPWISARSRR
eukprot:11217559-Alexandrium_andersonii.AAC.1